ncbi:hypothetical protein CTI12_AA014800 [Artemisia annua]|uniref:Uncharacterized protein n=1 Tax=Artemisia annua TaxID=35608 RepID=A0A2U1QL80_ARTAN|nr:hypothetical protein CTI12_AA014800 [Artemisia annua]
MAESSNAAVANNVEKRKDKKLAEAVAWYFEEKAKAYVKQRTEWEANEKRCMKERRKTTVLRRKVNQTRRNGKIFNKWASSMTIQKSTTRIS